jgi:hypothetical protein
MSSQCRLLTPAAATVGPIAVVAFFALASPDANASPAPQWAPQELGIADPFPLDTALTYNGRRAR